MEPHIAELRRRAEVFARDACVSLEERIRGVTPVAQDHVVAWRIKTESAIEAKARAAIQRGEPPTINDLVGVRVLAVHSGYFDRIRKELALWADEHDLVQAKFENKYGTPGLGDYRAIHIDYAPREAGKLQLGRDIKVEVQLMTWSRALHAHLCHTLLYKRLPPHDRELIRILELIAQEADRIDSLTTEARGGSPS